MNNILIIGKSKTGKTQRAIELSYENLNLIPNSYCLILTNKNKIERNFPNII